MKESIEKELTAKQLTARIGKKITLVSSEMNGLTVSYNEGQKWAYIGYETLNAHLPKSMMKHGLAIVPNLLDQKRTEAKVINSYGKEKTVITYFVTMEFDIIDTETGSLITRKWFGEASSYDDKCLAKAITETVKRFKFNMFSITSKDVKDSDATTIEYNQKPKKKTSNKLKKLQEWIGTDIDNKIDALNALKKLGVNSIEDVEETVFWTTVFEISETRKMKNELEKTEKELHVVQVKIEQNNNNTGSDYYQELEKEESLLMIRIASLKEELSE